MKRKISKNLKSFSLRRFDLKLEAEQAAIARREAISNQTGRDLEPLAGLPFTAEVVQGKNIENLIGSVSLPLGVAGPIKVIGEHAKGQFYLPCATTEGALVASLSRGCKVTNLAGGITTSIEYSGMTRAPLLRAKSQSAISNLKKWLKNNQHALAVQVKKVSQHAKFVGVETFTLGRYIWLRLSFDTHEAMGMNTVTIASQKIVDFILTKNGGLQLIAISGNLCVDKKPSWLNSLLGRGYRVTAECQIPAKIIKSELRTTAEKIAQLTQTKVWYGSALAGASSFNAHSANIIAALFAATGQDLGHITESSHSFTICETDRGNLYISVTLPNLILGAVGGGTNLKQQQTAQKLMLSNIEKRGQKLAVTKTSKLSYQLAEITGAAVLCGELSLLSALASGDLAAAHQKLGRGQNARK